MILALGSQYNVSAHRGVANYARKNHWHLSVVFGDSAGWVKDRFCHGIIATLRKNSPMSNAIIRRRLPTVELGIARPSLKIPHITGNNVDMGESAADYFMERGFRNFVWYSENNHRIAEDRYKGFKEKIRAAGFECQRLVLQDDFSQAELSWKTQQKWICEKIRSHPLPCAVYAFNDSQAVDLIDACLNAGIRIPEEVAVLGTDDNPLICPTAAVELSSIKHDVEAVGYRAAEELDKIINGAPSERKIIQLTHTGIAVRQSTNIFAINDPHVVTALKNIHENFRHSVSVTDIVQTTGLSRRSLETRFKTHLDQSILETLNKLRIENCRRLLRETNLSIADIAAQSGFNTPEYLHRVFAKENEMTPRQYRMQLRSE